MRVYVNRRQGLRREKYVSKIEYNFLNEPKTVGSLIKMLVYDSVKSFNENRDKEEIIKVLLSDEIEAQALVGKVAFGQNYNTANQDFSKAIINALQSYEDGLYNIFINDEKCNGLDDEVNLKEDDEITIIRLTMLAGRLW